MDDRRQVPNLTAICMHGVRFALAGSFSLIGVALFFNCSVASSLYPALGGQNEIRYSIAAIDLAGAVALLAGAKTVRIGAILLFWLHAVEGGLEIFRSIQIPIAQFSIAGILLWLAYHFAMEEVQQGTPE